MKKINARCPYCNGNHVYVDPETGELSCSVCQKLIGHIASGG